MLRKRWIILVAVLLCGSLHADIITLTDGTKIQGKIVAEMDNLIMVLVGNGSKKIRREDIQEIVKTKSEPPKQRFKVRDMDEIPFSSLVSHTDIWLERLEPLHQIQVKKLTAAKVGMRLRKLKALNSWVTQWCKEGFMATGIDETKDIISILTTEWKNGSFARDIHTVRIGCKSCKGSGSIRCNKCKGTGTRYAPGGRMDHKKIPRAKFGTCPVCKGKGQTLCLGSFHAAKKRVKKLGGLEKMVERELSVKKHSRSLTSFNRESISRIKDTKRLRKLAEQAHREGYYYIALEILRLCPK